MDGGGVVEPKRQLSYLFIVAFVLLWMLGPLTQLLQIISLPLHVEWGLSEAIILDPEFGWFRADELAIAWADMTYLIAGGIFIAGAFMRRPWSIPFGFYTMATMSFILLVCLLRWTFLARSGYDIISDDQKTVFYVYGIVYVLFGWFGMIYLWRNRRIYD